MKYTADGIKKELERLKSERGTWESHWQELADYILPRKNEITYRGAKGEKKGVLLLDNTAMQSNELLAGALHGLLTNPSALFFGLTSGDPEIDNKDSVKRWFQNSIRKTHLILNNSNFQTEVHELYLDLGCFGTGPMLIEEDSKLFVRFQSYCVSDVFVKEDSRGFVNEIYRYARDLEVSQLIELFGEKALPEEVMRKHKQGTVEKYSVIHCVYPLTLEEMKDVRVFEYGSKYILCWDQNNVELKADFYHEFPYVCPRWSKITGEKYGRSPGMVALPEAKTINKMTETIIKAAQKQVDPPLMVPDDGFILPLKTTPGGLNYYRKGMGDRIEPVFNKEIRVDFGYEVMKDHRSRIREAFYVDQLQLNNGPQMTATEVLQRTEEKMRLLGPMLGRMQSEFLQPLVDRVFGILLRRGVFDEIPEELSGRYLRVQYSSMIAKMQRSGELNDIMKTIQAIEPFFNIDKSVADIFNGDGAAKYIANILGFPHEGLNGDKEVKQMREARAQAQQQALQQQQQMQQADAMAKTGQAMQSMKM